MLQDRGLTGNPYPLPVYETCIIGAHIPGRGNGPLHPPWGATPCGRRCFHPRRRPGRNPPPGGGAGAPPGPRDAPVHGSARPPHGLAHGRGRRAPPRTRLRRGARIAAPHPLGARPPRRSGDRAAARPVPAPAARRGAPASRPPHVVAPAAGSSSATRPVARPLSTGLGMSGREAGRDVRDICTGMHMHTTGGQRASEVIHRLVHSNPQGRGHGGQRPPTPRRAPSPGARGRRGRRPATRYGRPARRAPGTPGAILTGPGRVDDRPVSRWGRRAGRPAASGRSHSRSSG